MSAGPDVRGDRPRFSLERAAAIAAERFDLRGELSTLPSERDQNFHVRTATGDGYVLKLSAALERRELLELQEATLRHVARVAGEGMAPAPVATAAGESLIEVAAEDGRQHFARVLTYLEGVTFARFRPHSSAVLAAVGGFLGRLDAALASFDHPAAPTDFHWDLGHAAGNVAKRLEHLTGARRALVERHLARFVAGSAAALGGLRRGVIHGDANDHNLIVTRSAPGRAPAFGLIDFGDMVRSQVIGELAVAAAYGCFDQPDPIAAAASVTAGYHAVFALAEAEVAVLFDLLCMRLCLSVVMSAAQAAAEPDNAYLAVSEAPAWALLERLDAVEPVLAEGRLRHACGLEPSPGNAALVAYLAAAEPAPILEHDLRSAPVEVFDLGVASLELGVDDLDVTAWTERLLARMARAGAVVGIGRYDEPRVCYEGELFAAGAGDRRTIHLGIDLFVAPGSPLFAPLAATVHSLANNANPLDYGPTVILEHDDGAGGSFYTLYGHLGLDCLERLAPGQPLARGEPFALVGDEGVNGGWTPHVHFQVIADILGREGDFPGVAPPDERAVWLSLCPDPNLLLRIPAAAWPPPAPGPEEIVAGRRAHLGPSLSTSYREPIEIVRGRGTTLFDGEGRAYLDAVNNVCHVGHCHPRVVAAGQRQMAVVNTNTRYLHDDLVRYSARLAATLPEGLDVCFLVCSGSEANELALRLAETYTGRRHVVCLEGGYHGNTRRLVDLSPYKLDGAGGWPSPEWALRAPLPDPYRGRHRDPATAGECYAADLADVIAAAGGEVAAFLAEALPGCGGQIVPPAGYLEAAYRHVRAAGGVCIADEVQTGFGRVGSHLWAFETQGVVPDIVTLGKPIGNGHPLGAVVTTRAIADAFATGMEYFNTFGGNPVSCAIGLAVLDVIEDEGLQDNARVVGEHLLGRLAQLAERHPVIGDVRGRGLFLGVELVLDRDARTPAPAHAAHVVEAMRARRILLSRDGPDHDVIKIKPPIVFRREEADAVIDALDEVLGEDALRIREPSRG